MRHTLKTVGDSPNLVYYICAFNWHQDRWPWWLWTAISEISQIW